MAMSRCKSCGAEILWAVTVNGKRMPFDPDPVPEGTFVLTETDEDLLTADYGAQGDGFVSHFSTCPHADQHRR